MSKQIFWRQMLTMANEDIFAGIAFLKDGSTKITSGTIGECAEWADDVRSAFSESKIILVSSENATWDQEINQEIIRKKYEEAGMAEEDIEKMYQYDYER